MNFPVSVLFCQFLFKRSAPRRRSNRARLFLLSFQPNSGCYLCLDLGITSSNFLDRKTYQSNPLLEGLLKKQESQKKNNWTHWSVELVSEDCQALQMKFTVRSNHSRTIYSCEHLKEKTDYQACRFHYNMNSDPNFLWNRYGAFRASNQTLTTIIRLKGCFTTHWDQN